MVSLPSRRSAGAISTAAGVVYAIGVLTWIFSSGVYFADSSLPAVAVGLAYVGVGMFLIGSVPVYLLLRLSLVTPALTTVWILGTTVDQWLHGTHLHPLSSYLTVWPLLLGFAVGVGMAEALVRTGADHWFDHLGLRTLR
jgi:hypothetical protein